MAACCCLCRDPVSADHRRRKKLHGLACKIAKAVLRELSPVPLEALVETREPTAVLCYGCERTLNNIHSLAAKVETLKAGVREKVSALQIVTLCSGKRPRSTPDTDLPPTKQQHIQNPDSVPSPSPS